MTNSQKIMAAIAVVLAVILVYQWQAVKKSENGPAKLMHDINDHALAGVLRSDLEPYLSQRGGDVSYDPTPGQAHSASSDHVIFRNIRHIGNRIQNLKADFYYDAGDHLVYYTLHPAWENQKR
jgi:hypothetical protein